MATTTTPTEGVEPALAAEIRAEMARQGVKQTRIATRLGLSSRQVHRLLNGDTPLTLTRAAEFADALRVDLDVLLERTRSAA